MNNYYIKNVFKLRGFIRVKYSNDIENLMVDYADKYGQYNSLKIEMKNKLTTDIEILKMYLKC